MAVNQHRGEVSVTLRGKTYTMRPTFQALAEMERQTGIGTIDLANRFIQKRYGIFEMAAVITAGLKGAGEPAVIEKVGNMVFEAGAVNLAAPCIEFLTNALTGGEKPQPGEGAAAEAQ
jgi:hypothetical protein